MYVLPSPKIHNFTNIMYISPFVLIWQAVLVQRPINRTLSFFFFAIDIDIVSRCHATRVCVEEF